MSGSLLLLSPPPPLLVLVPPPLPSPPPLLSLLFWFWPCWPPGGALGCFGLLEPPKMKMQATTRPMTAITARPPPMRRVFFDFSLRLLLPFLPLTSSDLSGLPLAPALPLPGFRAVTPSFFGFLDGFDAIPSSAASSSSS